MLLAFLLDRRLDQIAQTALMVLIDSQKTERLLSTGDRSQHLGNAEDQSCIRQKHHRDLRTLVEQGGQAQQSAGDRHNLQFAPDRLSVLNADGSRSGLRKLQSRRAAMFAWLERLGHDEGYYLPECWQA